MRKSAAPSSVIQTFKSDLARDVKRIKRRCRILKIKYFLLFVLPILLIFIAYQTAKQFIKLKIQSMAKQKTAEPEPAAVSK